MEIILNNAKLSDWMRNFYIEIPKTTPRKLFQWMESDSSQIIPFWMFPDIKDSEGEEYFDEYDTSRHRKPVPLPIVMHNRLIRTPASLLSDTHGLHYILYAAHVDEPSRRVLN